MIGLLGLDYSISTDVLYVLILNLNIILIMGLYKSTNTQICFRRPVFPVNNLIFKDSSSTGSQSTPRDSGTLRISCPILDSFLE